MDVLIGRAHALSRRQPATGGTGAGEDVRPPLRREIPCPRNGTTPSFGIGPGEHYRFAVEFPRQGMPVAALESANPGGGSAKVWHSVRVAAPVTPRLCLCKIGPLDPPDHPLAQAFISSRLLG